MTSVTEAKLEILPDSDALAQHVADWLIDIAVTSSGRFAVNLSGGSTPRRLYERLASPACRERFPWARTHWFWGDERFVPPDDAQSNYRMVRLALLSQAPIPPANIHSVPTENMSPEAAAAAYERELKTFYGADTIDPARPLFDVTFLGLGPDGHTASLFPGVIALEERRRWVVAVTDTNVGPRITLTYPALGSSRHAAFLVEGKEKAGIFARLWRGDRDLPSARLVLPPGGHIWLFSDAAAAGATDRDA